MKELSENDYPSVEVTYEFAAKCKVQYRRKDKVFGFVLPLADTVEETGTVLLKGSVLYFVAEVGNISKGVSYEFRSTETATMRVGRPDQVRLFPFITTIDAAKKYPGQIKRFKIFGLKPTNEYKSQLTDRDHKLLDVLYEKLIASGFQKKSE